MSANEVVMISVFGLVFIVSCIALKRVKLFNHPARVAISACVAALCVMSLFGGLIESASPRNTQPSVATRSLENESAKPDQSLRKIILLPYLVLVLSLPGLLLLWLAAKLLSFKRPDVLRQSRKPQQTADSKIYGHSGTMIMKDGKLYYDDSK